MEKLISQKIKELPKRPGVYIFKDAAGMILYVGKAVRLKDRVSSYFRKDAGLGSVRIQHMISQISDLDYVVTDNEVESLVLENNFIKQLKPKYNVRLRDDKNYLFIKINVKDEIPTINYDRKTDDRNARYFGPYTSSASMRDTLRTLRKIFPYCANSKITGKPCFFYHIQKCPGVCIGKISLEDYRNNHIQKIIRFLEGRQNEVLKDLQSQMRKYATGKQYEKAARVRDQIFALNRVLERQKLVYPTKVSQDVFSVHMDTVAAVNLFMIRDGKLIQKENFILENTKHASESEVLEAFLKNYYLEASNLPKEILLPVKINTGPIQVLLTQRSKNLKNATAFFKFRNIRVNVPSRGQKLKLVRLGRENAKQYLEAQSDKHLLEEARLMSALKELQRVLKTTNLPARVEAFDISNIQGTNAVGSMIVFDFGRPQKNSYRKFKISAGGGSASGGKSSFPKPDDFAMMKEMLERRFKRSGKFEVGSGKTDSSHLPLPTSPSSWPLPDLVLIDGGKGQLSTAVSVLRKYKLNIPIIGLAKRLEEIFLPGKSIPITLPVNSIALFLLQRIRDEAHRFAVTYHRKLRSRSAIRSVFDSIPGVGPAKKRLLIERFGSVQKVREASLTELAAVVGSKLAEKIKASI